MARWLDLLGIGIALYVLIGFFWAIVQESFSNGPKTRSAPLGEWIAFALIALFGMLVLFGGPKSYGPDDCLVSAGGITERCP